MVKTGIWRAKLEALAGICFLIFAAWKIFMTPVPPIDWEPSKIPPLLDGSDRGIPPLGEEYDLFTGKLPPEKTMSFIMDRPFNNYSNSTKLLYTAQSRLAPVVFNPSPGENYAVVFCANENTARRRAAESGYGRFLPIEDGKGIALRDS